MNPNALVPLLADAGIPMIVLTFPAMVMLLIPVIVIEGFLCKKWLGLTLWQSMKSNAVSNFVSTIIGMPVAWAILLALEFGTIEIADKSNAIQHWHSPIANVIFFFLGSAWIAPAEDEYAWLVPAAILVLLVPFFFMSYYLEYLVMRFMVGIPDDDPPELSYPRVRVSVRNANLITYGVMFLATTVWMLLLLRKR